MAMDLLFPLPLRVEALDRKENYQHLFQVKNDISPQITQQD